MGFVLVTVIANGMKLPLLKAFKVLKSASPHYASRKSSKNIPKSISMLPN